MSAAKTKGMPRSETVTVRLDQRLRYLAELAARKQRRTLSSFIEWAIEDSLSRIELVHGEEKATLADLAWPLWDVDEVERFTRLAIRYPELLTHSEQVLWKAIREHGGFWEGRRGPSGKWVWQTDENSLLVEKLKEYWPALIRYVDTDPSMLRYVFSEWHPPDEEPAKESKEPSEPDRF